MSKKSSPSPVMAVLVSPSTIRNLQKQIVNPRIKMLVEANKEVKNILYYFCLKQVTLEGEKITGCYWDSGEKKWLSKEFPYPDILYLRGGIKQQYSHIFEEIYSNVNRRGKVINHPRFNKWQLYEIMSKDPVMKSYMPATREVNQPEDIARMLEDYKVVYLKSHLGRKGKQVLRVETRSDGCYQYSYLNKGQSSIQTAADFQALLEIANEFFRGKSYLVQQSIELMKFDKRLVDMKAELQRNGDGGLEIVGISVRLGKPGSPITTHAHAFKFDYFFRTILGYSKKRIGRLQSDVNEFLFSVYRFIEKNYGEYVEIGIDFAIDKHGKLWLIEANSQSTKVSLEKSYNEKVLSGAYKNILEYARYKFKTAQGGGSD